MLMLYGTTSWNKFPYQWYFASVPLFQNSCSLKCNSHTHCGFFANLLTLIPNLFFFLANFDSVTHAHPFFFFFFFNHFSYGIMQRIQKRKRWRSKTKMEAKYWGWHYISTVLSTVYICVNLSKSLHNWSRPLFFLTFEICWHMSSVKHDGSNGV